jgi:cardiolipin synthase A/B
MNKIMELSFSLARELPTSKINSIANGLLNNKTDNSLLESVGSPQSKAELKSLLDSIKATGSKKELVAYILQSASYTISKINEKQSVELVLTGPETAFVNSRKTEQVLLDLIAKAKNELFLVSFVAKGWDALLNSIIAAADRGVIISILMETSKEHGGTLDEDPISMLDKNRNPKVNLYRWTNKPSNFQGGKIHAKIAVADKKSAFISSANFTGHAMEKNFEAGVLLTGGNVPRDVHEHLLALVYQGIISQTNM